MGLDICAAAFQIRADLVATRLAVELRRDAFLKPPMLQSVGCVPLLRETNGDIRSLPAQGSNGFLALGSRRTVGSIAPSQTV
jgi:hypothetical protein